MTLIYIHTYFSFLFLSCSIFNQKNIKKKFHVKISTVCFFDVKTSAALYTLKQESETWEILLLRRIKSFAYYTYRSGWKHFFSHFTSSLVRRECRESVGVTENQTISVDSVFHSLHSHKNSWFATAGELFFVERFFV